MKAVLINGSPRKNGNTFFALKTVDGVLQKHGIETEFIEIGNGAIHGCSGCGVCKQKKNRRCVCDDDILNRNMDKLIEADGMVIGSPVYHAGINGALKCFLDRAFFVASGAGQLFRHKVGAGVVAVRRGGEASAFDQLNKYFTISEMFVPSSLYWNMVFGMAPGEAEQDVEGIMTMQALGENMAWLMQSVRERKDSLPGLVEKKRMNFIR